MPGHRAGDQLAAQAVAQQLGELVDEVAQVCAAFESHARHALAEQVAYGAHHKVAQRVIAHGHFSDDAYP